MSVAHLFRMEYPNVIPFPSPLATSHSSRSKSKFTKDGRPKPQEIDSIKTEIEIRQFLQYFLDRKQYRNFALFTLGISTAYRCGDILKMRWCDVMEADGPWKSDLDLIEEKTGHRRKMEITTPIKASLDMYRKSLDSICVEDYIFKSTNSRRGEGAALTVRSVHKILKSAGRELNLPYNIGSHTMRKTYGYWYLQEHKNDITALATLQEIFGHSSEKITLRYCGISKEELRCNNRHVSDKWMQLMNELK